MAAGPRGPVKRCPSCSLSNANDADFCIGCGFVVVRDHRRRSRRPPACRAESARLPRDRRARRRQIPDREDPRRRRDGRRVPRARHPHRDSGGGESDPRSSSPIDPEFRTRTLAEGRALARIDHANVVRLNAVVVEQAALYLVMQFIDGEPLDKMIERHVAARTPIPLEQVALDLPHDLARRGRCARRGAHPPRSQAGQHSHSQERRRGEGHRLRHRQGRRGRQGRARSHQGDHRLALVHGARAGARATRPRQARRHLRPRHSALRASHRARAVRRAQRLRDHAHARRGAGAERDRAAPGRAALHRRRRATRVRQGSRRSLRQHRRFSRCAQRAARSSPGHRSPARVPAPPRAPAPPHRRTRRWPPRPSARPFSRRRPVGRAECRSASRANRTDRAAGSPEKEHRFRRDRGPEPSRGAARLGFGVAREPAFAIAAARRRLAVYFATGDDAATKPTGTANDGGAKAPPRDAAPEVAAPPSPLAALVGNLAKHQQPRFTAVLASDDTLEFRIRSLPAPATGYENGEVRFRLSSSPTARASSRSKITFAPRLPRASSTTPRHRAILASESGPRSKARSCARSSTERARSPSTSLRSEPPPTSSRRRARKSSRASACRRPPRIRSRASCRACRESSTTAETAKSGEANSRLKRSSLPLGGLIDAPADRSSGLGGFDVEPVIRACPDSIRVPLRRLPTQ